MKDCEYTITFEGDSMLPTFKSGYKLIIKPVQPDDITIGDIAIFKRGRVVCHRILGKYRMGKSEYFLERGDNRKAGFIRSIKAEKVLGKVTAIKTPEGVDLDSVGENIVNTKLRYIMLSVLYCFGYKIKSMIFGTKKNRFIRKISLTVIKTLNYLV